jgi:hypothetical protein
MVGDMKPNAILRLTTLLAAGGSFAFSVFLYFANESTQEDRLNGIYVGLWVPSILALGAFIFVSGSRKD